MDLPFDPPEGVELVLDVSSADWIAERLRQTRPGPGVRVADVVPTGFDAYARILHPVRVPADADHPTTRWSELAERFGRTVHAEMQLEYMGIDLDPTREFPFEELLPDEVIALADCLRPFTSTPERCWFALWEGYGIYGAGVSLWWEDGEDPVVVAARERKELERARRAREQLEAIPRVETYNRAYYLFRGPLERAVLNINGVDHSPNLWWPDDRVWCVATEIDGYSTYVGASRSCIAALLADDRFEALATDTANRFDVWSDRINPAPPRLQMPPDG